MSYLLETLRLHQPLPRGPYPTARWPAGLTHLQSLVEASVTELQAAAAAVNARHVYTLPDRLTPPVDRQTTVTFEGATHTVALDCDPDQSAECWIDSVLIGGKWHSACDTFRDDFIRALEAQLQREFAAEIDAQAGIPQGVLA